MAKPYILIVAGHRSTNDPGNPTERDRTDDMSRAAVAAFRAAGYSVGYWQSELDRDAVADMTVGDLSTVATGCRNILLGRKDPMQVMLDLHFNGPESSLFSIVPDVTGLRSGYHDGAPANDTAANNTLDVELARTLSGHVSKALGGKTLYRGILGIPGVMSERETGVATSGGRWRLGMFGGTAIVRHRAVRLVVEFGGYNDFTRHADYANRCARGMVAAVNEVFNQDAGTPAPAPTKPTERKAFEVRFEDGLWTRHAPGFSGKFVTDAKGEPIILPKGTKGFIKDGPRSVDGMNWFDIEVEGFGSAWVPQGILWAIDIKDS